MIYHKRFFFYIISILLFVENINANSIFNEGDRLIDFYPPSVYGGDVQTWDVKGGDGGYVFFATGEGLSIYDGTRWIFPQSKGKKPFDLKTLYYDIKTKYIFCGGDNEFGFLEKDQFGQFIYTQIYHNEKADNPNMFWRIGRVKDYIFFGAKEIIFRYHLPTKKLDRIQPQHSFHFMHVVDDKVYVQEKDALYEITGLTLKAFPYSFSDRITSIMKDSLSGNLLVFREDIGLNTILKNGNLIENNSNSNLIVGKSRIFSVARTLQNTYLLGTILGGLFEMDSHGNIIRQVNEKNGLPYVSVLNVSTDSFGDIWMGLEGGVARMDNISNESYIVDYESKIGGIYALYNFDGKLYIGTNKGVFVRHADNRYQFLRGSQGQTWNFDLIEGELIVCHDKGIFRIKGDSLDPIYTQEGIWSINKVPFAHNYYISSNYHGFSVYQKISGRLKYLKDIDNYRGEARINAFDKYNYLWNIVTGKGFYRFTLSKDLDIVEQKLYTTPNTSKHSILISLDNQLIFHTGDKAYRYDSLQDSLVIDEYAQSIIRECGNNLSSLTQFGNIFWYTNKKEVGYLIRNHNRLTISTGVFEGAYDKRIPWVFQKVSRISENVFAYGLQNHIGLYKVPLQFDNAQHPSLVFSEIVLSDNGKITHSLLAENTINLSHNYESIRLYLTGVNKNRLIEYKLDGYSDAWILIKFDKYLELPRLLVGKYKLTIRNYGDNNDKYLELDIHVHSPWYLSLLSICCYILLLVIIIYLIRTYYRNKTKKILIEEEKKRLQQQKEYEKEKLESDLKEKDKKLASFMMNELQKNNLLTTIRSSLVDYIQNTPTKQDIKKCINNIDQQLNNQEDWKAFLKYFNNIYDGFFDRLLSTYPQLTISDMKLCAYLKLNLSTKEIAILLNISPASVDTARHRLRKKMNIASSVNLGYFLSTI